MFARPSWINVPFFLAGALKIVYDLCFTRSFRRSGHPKSDSCHARAKHWVSTRRREDPNELNDSD
jgi:hypothetical protein